MLSKFSVTNFKGFKEKFTLDLSKANGYSFNDKSVKNGIINNAIIYGPNGAGKSNIGFAIFDIVNHLTDFEQNKKAYFNYSNAYTSKDEVRFEYHFQFNNNTVKYFYTKIDSQIILSEELQINGNLVASVDRGSKFNHKLFLIGSETLNYINNPNLSILKYVRNNAILKENIENKVFDQFYNFVSGMLLFHSGKLRSYMGLEYKIASAQSDIIEKNNLFDFQKFLKKAKIHLELVLLESHKGKEIGVEFNDIIIPFRDIASSGTLALTIFYFWLQRIKEKGKVSFLFLDEFDAFYHHELSAAIVEELKSTGVQFILTTHNTTIMSNEILRPDCYFLLEDNKIKSLSHRTEKELREAHNIEKMYKAGAFYE